MYSPWWFTGEQGEAFMALMAFVAPYIYNVDTLPLKTKKLWKTNLGSHVYFGD
jgi:hypothetical protein